MRGVFTNIARYDLALNGSTRKREKMNKVETTKKYVGKVPQMIMWKFHSLHM